MPSETFTVVSFLVTLGFGLVIPLKDGKPALVAADAGVRTWGSPARARQRRSMKDQIDEEISF